MFLEGFKKFNNLFTKCLGRQTWQIGSIISRMDLHKNINALLLSGKANQRNVTSEIHFPLKILSAINIIL